MIPALPVQATVTQILDRAIASESSRGLQHVIITTTSSVPGSPSRSVVDLSLNRAAGKFLVVITNTGKSGHTATRTFFVTGHRLMAYDKAFGQYLVRTLQVNRTLGQNLVDELHVDPAVLLAIDPPTADRVLFHGLRLLTGWQINEGAAIGLVRRASAKGQTSEVDVRFAKSSLLPMEFAFSSNGKGEQSVFEYRKEPGVISFSPPPGTREVSRFTPPPPGPHFDSMAAASAAGSCRRAYSGLKSLSFKVHAGPVSSVIWSGHQAREDDPGLSWAFDGRRLTIEDRRKHSFYSGDATVEDIPDYLNPLGARIDPMLKSLLEGQNPMTNLYTAGLSGRLAGTIALNGVTSDILELKRSDIRIQIQIRSTDHLIGGFLTENFDPNHKLVSRSDRQFEYSGVNESYPAPTFVLNRAGSERALTLSSLHKKLK